MRFLEYCAKSAVLAIVYASLFANTVYAEERLTIGGTGGDLGTMQQLATHFEKDNPGIVVDVFPSLGSGGGIKAVSAGAIDLAISSRPLKDKEKNPQLMSKPYAVTAMAIVTERSDAMDSLSTDDLVKIFDGRTKSWPDGKPIRIVLRPDQDTDTKVIKDSIPDLAASMEVARKIRGVVTGLTDQDAADFLEKIPGSLGFLSLSVVNGEKRRLSVISFNGVKPSAEKIQSDLYPAHKTFYFVWKESGSSAVREFLDFMDSQLARDVMEKTGHLVLKGT
jgi:phosphate transport system substrate-binding protein